MKPFVLIVCAALLSACNNQNETAAEQTHKEATGNSTDSPHAGGSHNTGTLSTPLPSMSDLMHETMAAMKAVPPSGSADRDFAALMKAHHQGAVQMAEALLQHGADSSIKTMARQMLADQQREIKAFDTYLATHPHAAGSNTLYTESLQQMQHGHMATTNDTTLSYDKQFVQQMIPHHQGAVTMAQTYLRHGAKDEGLKKMAQQIISSQQKEMALLEAWLRKS